MKAFIGSWKLSLELFGEVFFLIGMRIVGVRRRGKVVVRGLKIGYVLSENVLFALRKTTVWVEIMKGDNLLKARVLLA